MGIGLAIFDGETDSTLAKCARGCGFDPWYRQSALFITMAPKMGHLLCTVRPGNAMGKVGLALKPTLEWKGIRLRQGRVILKLTVGCLAGSQG